MPPRYRTVRAVVSRRVPGVRRGSAARPVARRVGRQHEVAVRRDARQLAAAVGVEADADQQHPQRRGLAGLARRRRRPYAGPARNVPALEQVVDGVETRLEHFEAPLRRGPGPLAVGTREEVLGRDLHDRHLDRGRRTAGRRGGGGAQPEARAEGQDQQPDRGAGRSVFARCAVDQHAVHPAFRFAVPGPQKS